MCGRYALGRDRDELEYALLDQYFPPPHPEFNDIDLDEDDNDDEVGGAGGAGGAEEDEEEEIRLTQEREAEAAMDELEEEEDNERRHTPSFTSSSSPSKGKQVDRCIAAPRRSSHSSLTAAPHRSIADRDAVDPAGGTSSDRTELHWSRDAEEHHRARYNVAPQSRSIVVRQVHRGVFAAVDEADASGKGKQKLMEGDYVVEFMVRRLRLFRRLPYDDEKR